MVPLVAGVHHLPAGPPMACNLNMLLSVMTARIQLDLRAALANLSPCISDFG